MTLMHQATKAAADGTERLRAALAAEYAALYAYGRLGVLLEKEIRPEAHAAEVAHRARRDALIVYLDQIKAPPVEAESAYALPFPVSDRESALRLATKVEESVASTWRSALATSSPTTAPPAPSPQPSASPTLIPLEAQGDPRRMALGGFTDAAVRATRWRKIAGLTPVTTTFPGRQA
jgi:hypothetical protein